MNGTIDLAAVAVFVRVAETASFRGAADALGIPRSTVSRRVADLETQLGTRLLKRTTRNVSLTQSGPGGSVVQTMYSPCRSRRHTQSGPKLALRQRGITEGPGISVRRRRAA